MKVDVVNLKSRYEGENEGMGEEKLDDGERDDDEEENEIWG